jgi:hypothetical protein
VSGRIAQHAAGHVRIRLERPVPLQVPLQLETLADGGMVLSFEGTVLARARPAPFELSVPAAPGYLEALEASRHFVGFSHHPYPSCFVCGTERARGDGLRVFAGRCGTRGLVAAPWTAGAALAGGDGKVRPEFISAVLDCPGAFASREVPAPILLGEFAAHIDRCVHVDEPCVVIGWKIACNGRKTEVGTALFDEDGELCARARTLWIELRPQA